MVIELGGRVQITTWFNDAATVLDEATRLRWRSSTAAVCCEIDVFLFLTPRYADQLRLVGEGGDGY